MRRLEEEHGEDCFALFELADIPGRRMAELESEEKNAISHRGNALRIFAEKLKEFYDADK